jgi:hypothetical protein
VRCHICRPQIVEHMTGIPPTPTEIPTVQPAPHTPHARDDQAGGAPATGREMLWEVIELAGGFGAMLMPLLLLAVPGSRCSSSCRLRWYSSSRRSP